MQIPLLVSQQWLLDNLANPEFQVIENAWNRESYHKAHICGALYVPVHPYLKKFNANKERTQQVMEAEDFMALCHVLGLRRDQHYVIYDDYFGLFAARFWWVCRHFGLHNFSILDGSWRGWMDKGFPVSSRLEVPAPGTDIIIDPNTAHFIGWEELLRIHRDPNVQVWDNRRAGEYSGEEEPVNRRRGHVPGALHLEWTDLLTEAASEGEPRFLKPVEELEQLMSNLGLQRDKTIITYCQSGNRAAFCDFVLELLGYPQHRMYDASMGEWANLTETPLVCGNSAEEA